MLDLSSLNNGIYISNNNVYFKKNFSERENLLARCIDASLMDNNVYEVNIRKTTKNAIFNFMKECFPEIVLNDNYKQQREYIYDSFSKAYEDNFNKLYKKAEDLDSSFSKLYAHQKEGVYFGCYRHFNYIAFEQGLGKSITAIFISKLMNIKCTLVVCPAICKDNWREELIFWGYKEHEIVVFSGKQKQYNGEQFIIINYELMDRFSDYLKQLPNGISHIILDEGHYIKNPEAKRSKAISNLIYFYNCKVTFLSGTPTPNDITDIYNPMKIVSMPIAKSKQKFLNMFTVKKINSNRYSSKQYLVSIDVDFLSYCISNFLIRKRKKDCTDLPDKIYNKLFFSLDEYQNEYNEYMNEFMESLKGDESKQKIEMCEQRVNIITSKSKVKHVVELAEAISNDSQEVLVDGDKFYAPNKVIIFSGHTEPLNMLEEKFGSKCIKIDGSVSTDKRMELINKFKRSYSKNILIANTAAAGIGINLVHKTVEDRQKYVTCFNVIFIDFPRNNAALEQAIDRIHRFGQENNINIYFCFAKDSIDEKRFQRIMHKYKDVSVLIDNKKADFNFENITSEFIDELKEQAKTFTKLDTNIESEDESQQEEDLVLEELDEETLSEKDEELIIEQNKNKIITDGEDKINNESDRVSQEETNGIDGDEEGLRVFGSETSESISSGDQSSGTSAFDD